MIEFGTRYWYTSTQYDTLYPSWEETFTLHAEKQVPLLQGIMSSCMPCCAVPQMDPDAEVVLTVYDHDTFSGDDPMGQARIRLPLPLPLPLPLTLPLTLTDGPGTHPTPAAHRRT